MLKWPSSGMKIGMKMTMISVHSSGQPRMKMMTCESSMNSNGRQIHAEHPMLDQLLAAQQREGCAEKIAEPTSSRHHGRGLRGQEHRFRQHPPRQLAIEQVPAGCRPVPPMAAASVGVAMAEHDRAQHG